TDERVLPGEKGLAIDVAGAIPLVGPVEGNLHGVLASTYRRRAIAVEGVEALAGGVVIRIVVVSLIGHYGLLVEEGGDSAVVANDKHDVVLIRLCVGQECDIDSAGPRGLGGQSIGGRPLAFDHSRRSIRWASGLQRTVEWADVLHEAPPQPLVPTHPIDVNRIGLRRVDAHIEGDVLTLVHASGGRITLDLAPGVRCRRAEVSPPLGRPGLLILDDDRVAGLPMS